MTELSEAKQRLIEQRLAAPKTTSARPAAAPLPHRPPGPAPFSPGQAALLYEHNLAAESAIYNVTHAYRIRGPLDADRLVAAIQASVAKHETLRTACDESRTVLAAERAAQIVEIAATEADFAALAQAEAVRRFDLQAGPLARVTLARLGAGDFGLVLALHHVSTDAASLAILWKDISLAYQGGTLAPETTTYSDHAVWQAAARSEADETFWDDHLGADPVAVRFPLGMPAPGQPDGYRTVDLAVSPTMLQSAGLRDVPFFLGLFAALLERYSDNDEVVVGVAASTRDHPSLESVVGYFLTLLPLRLAVATESSAERLTAATEATLAAALSHRRQPYSRIAARLRQRGAPEPDPARVLFVMDESHQPKLAGCTVDGRLVHNGVAVADLTLFVRRTGEGYEASAEYDGRRFGAADIDGLLAEYRTLTNWAATNPGAQLDPPLEADLLGPELSPLERTLPAIVAHHGAAHAERPAVRCGTQSANYGELVLRVRHIAGALRDAGVGRGDRVAILLPRSVDLVATILAAGWLGAAYVPIDPSYPAARIGQILAASAAGMVVTNGAVNPAITTPKLVVTDISASTSAPAEPVAELEDPAYVIFTSGSTGSPKGVLVRQRQLAASTQARVDFYDEQPGVFLVVSSFGFDSSVAGLFWTLATGGEVVLPTEHEVHDIDALLDLLDASQATHLLMVPTLYQALLRRDANRLATVRCAIVAGEVCTPSVVELHNRALRDAHRSALYNEYGPTEATVWATVHRCQPGETVVPIGCVIPGGRLRVADRWLRPRPPGAAGELLIGGVGVADGYLDQPETTAARFVIDPRTNERFYRTGDLVRRRPDGSLLFLGRVDHQLSVGGVRVEPEEIETALTGCDGITGAIVRLEQNLDDEPLTALSKLPPSQVASLLAAAATAESPAHALAVAMSAVLAGSPVLVGYLEGTDIDTVAVRRRLLEQLPRNVVPTILESLATLPRTEHGKLDRSALAPPLRVRGRSAATVTEPTNSRMVDALVAAWREVLENQTIDLDTDFFAAGGDSLLAVELVLRLEKRIGRRVPISALVEGRTPRRLDALIATPTLTLAESTETRRTFVVPLRPFGERSPLVIMPPGGGNLVVFDPFVQAFDARYPVIGFDLPGADRDDELPTSVEQLCDVFLPQLLEAQPKGPYRFLGWSFGGVVALELARRLLEQGHEVDLVAMIDTLFPGMQRSGRSKEYLRLARERDVVAIVKKLEQMVRVRLMLKMAARRGEQAAAAGVTLTPTERNNWLTIKVDDIVERYQPQPYLGRVLFFAARTTYPWRTTEPWRRIIPHLDVVSVEGTHEGSDGLLSGARAVNLANEVAARLTR